MTHHTTGTILLCDLDGMLLAIPTDGLGIAVDFTIGRSLVQQVAETDVAAAHDFIFAVRRQSMALNWMLAFDLKEGRTVLQVDGSVINDGLVVIVRRLEVAGSDVSLAAIDAIGGLNNRLINQQRELVRASIEAARVAVTDGMAHPAKPSAVESIQVNTPMASKPFSVRENEVIPLFLAGFSNLRIAQYLGIEESAAKARLRTIYRKLGVASRPQAIMALLARDGRLTPK
ncbi:helix-turn-helix transcriptional regulator [Telmatospirillum siberiense]|uniref:HTH luxR-type domain-containing protein n=1 Tax=Telmatospirillum siberiense TaxID=382514 RepID=A0A2N3Q1T6_9PROT|nr:helix-turn-helix transcriptional regulator [Telmatospirillum siberiense]PKU26605.1 hypothetical protein CWS72_01875 [Telmatospirillum siberiense]